MEHKHHTHWAYFGLSIFLIAAAALTYTKNITPNLVKTANTPTAVQSILGGSDLAPVVIAAGDIASCNSSGDELTSRLVESIPGTLITLGNNAYQNGTERDYEKCFNPSWGQFLSRMKPAIGNLDYNTAGAEAFFDYFSTILGETDEAYYSYEVGNWQVIALDSNCVTVGCGVNSAQSRWLKSELQGSKSKCTLVYMHHPLFSSGRISGSNKQVEPLWQVMYDSGVDVVLSAHERNYERFAPQTPQGRLDTAKGIREFVVGTGGRGLYGFGPAIPNSEVRNVSALGVLKLNLASDNYSWQFVPVAGKTFTDTGTEKCH
jgi:acid phosphatase type 7